VSQIGFSQTNALKKATVIMGNDSVLTDLVSLGVTESLRCSSDNDKNNTIRAEDPSGNTGTTGTVREEATTADVTAVANVEAMITDAVSGEPHEDDDDGDEDTTTIYEHGVCE